MFYHWVIPCDCRCCSFPGNMGGSTNTAFPYRIKLVAENTITSLPVTFHIVLHAISITSSHVSVDNFCWMMANIVWQAQEIVVSQVQRKGPEIVQVNNVLGLPARHTQCMPCVGRCPTHTMYAMCGMVPDTRNVCHVWDGA